jgi:hypothetical protein
MGKMSEFISGDDNGYSMSDETIMGDYGCSVCELDVPFAKFNEAKGLLYWVCVEGHRTEISIV